MFAPQLAQKTAPGTWDFAPQLGQKAGASI